MRKPSTKRAPENGVMNGKKRKASVDEREPAVPNAALRVHRCRFIDWMPHAVHVMSFNPTGDQLAVARANGDVEMWQIVARKWHLKYVISGSTQSKISAMIWSQSNRLFVASFDGTLWEVDLESLRKKNVVDSNGGPIWCMDVNNETETLAVGCEDGRIRLFSFQNDDEIYFVKGFVSTNRRVVSLAWHAGANKMFSGSEDGIIHCWNAVSGRNESRITLETLAKQKCVVWSLLVLQDLTIVSGDSHGHLSFWNGHTGTLLQKFSHLTADILALCVDSNNSMLFASGVDNQVAEYRRVGESEGSWSYAYSHRAHSHDVRAMALSSAPRPVLVSGGIDTQLVWYNANSFNTSRPFKIASMPYRKTVSLSSEKRVLLVQKSTSLDLWRLASSETSSAIVDTTATPQHQLLLELQVGSAHNIACSALSPNGEFIACATAQELKLFSLDASSGFQPRKLTLPDGIAKESARVVAFSPDSTRLVIATATQKLRVLDVTKIEVLKTFNLVNSSSNDATDSETPAAPVLSLSISLDGQWLAVGDASNQLSIYNLDSMQFYCHLPRPSEMHTNMGFNPSGKLLVVTLVSNSFVCYDVEKKALSDWYRQHHERFPKAIVEGRNIKGMAFDPAQPDFLYLYSQSSLYQINMSDRCNSPKLPATASNGPASKKVARRARAPSVGAESDRVATDDDLVDLEDGLCRVINRYRPLSFVDFVDAHELLVVETPWLKVLARLPGALQRHKYGK
ncbi:hypothetical protein Poli38472_009812 [Pythium oligandrum]|uniref:Uncharacterized protein n=1 Tax=Pythium oligandrum TaxID=41045 RepID=A0A8K1CF48_PYTOL|nr:hypothetical protein Poli38472_009812 [Pythium oligandrum]|eukprot:TMW62319.1 hypothetical protein Poli38472_009812 [Pythium oligandrum]